MKLEGTLPIPTLTATILPSGEVVVHESNWQARIKRHRELPRGMHTCGACGEPGHNRKNRACPRRSV